MLFYQNLGLHFATQSKAHPNIFLGQTMPQLIGFRHDIKIQELSYSAQVN